MVQFGNAAQLESNIFRRSKSYHNMGVVMQNHREYAQAIEYYKMALRCNPQDNKTRYNLALCKKLLKNNQQNQNNKNNKDKNKNDKNKDKKNDKNKNKDGQNKNDQNKDKQNKNQDKNNSDKNKQNQEKMSRDNAEQLLNAAIQQEKATKRKMQKAMSQPRRKVYDKNW